MGYVDDNLVPGERLVYRARLHWKIYKWAILFGVLTIGAVIVAWLAPEQREPLMIGALIGLLVTGVAFAWAYVKSWSSEFAVTDKRVLIKTGLVNRHTMETLLTKVENISVEQGVWGRMLGYGTIRITGTGGTTEPFADISAPLEFRKHVQTQTLSYEERRDAARFSDVPAATPTATAAPARDERECPYCAERILAKAKVCRYCGREVQPVAS